MKLYEYAKYDGLGLASLVTKREISPKELAQTALAAIEKLNPQIKAVVEVYYDRIESWDEKQLQSGLFYGVPFLIKDVGGFEAGRKTEWGSRLCEGYISKEDTYFIQMLRASGVNNIGRTNVPEFCISGTAENLLYGNTSTPWKLGYSAGGSSGGAAAAVSAGIVPIAHGSDIGGSIRIPASLCGCVGLKPSRGRVSAGPRLDESGFGMAQNLVQTRSVRDTAAMLDCLSIPQPGDPFVIRQPDRSFLSEVNTTGDSLNIAFSIAPLMDAPIHPETVAAVKQVAQILENMGHNVTEDAPSYDIEPVTEHFTNLWFFGFDRVFESFARITGRKISSETLEPCTLAIYEAAKKMDPYAFLDATQYFNKVRRDFGTFFQRYDIWLTPTTAQPAEPWGKYHQNLPNLTALEYITLTDPPIQYTIPYNITGLPSISLPLSQTSSGLPIGIQMGAKHSREDLLIRLSSALEIEKSWVQRVPPLHVSN